MVLALYAPATADVEVQSEEADQAQEAVAHSPGLLNYLDNRKTSFLLPTQT